MRSASLSTTDPLLRTYGPVLDREQTFLVLCNVSAKHTESLFSAAFSSSLYLMITGFWTDSSSAQDCSSPNAARIGGIW